MSRTSQPLGTVTLAATTLYVADLPAAVAWYRDTLGLEPAMTGADAEAYASYLLGGAIVVLEPRTAALEAAPPGSESTTVNLVIDGDPAVVHGELLAAGVACGPLVTSPHWVSFLMRDPDGNRFYVTAPRTAESRGDVAEVLGRSPE